MAIGGQLDSLSLGIDGTFQVGEVPEAIESSLECNAEVIQPAGFVRMSIGGQLDGFSVGIDRAFQVGEVPKAIESSFECSAEVA